MIEIEDVGKCYRIYSRPGYRLLELAGWPRSLHREFWSLRHVYLSIPQGTTFGLIGPNGAGKSTLLRLLSGISKPTEGRLHVQGSLAAILEMGTGFHPEFSGRSNVYMNCALQGLTREETDAQIERIIDFAELEDFIDQPIRMYSTGMRLRLAFSVATSVNPDVLIIDEALSVGDEHFRQKCLTRLNEFKAEGKTIVIVSHDLATVRHFCSQVALLDGGAIRSAGAPDEVLDHYLAMVHRGQEHPGARPGEETEQLRWGSGEITFDSVEMRDESGLETRLFDTDQSAEIVMTYRVHRPVRDVVFGFLLYRSDGAYINGSNHYWHPQSKKMEFVETGRQGTLRCQIPRLPLLAGRYYITVCCYNQMEGFPQAVDHWERVLTFEVSEREMGQHGMISLDTEWDFES